MRDRLNQRAAASAVSFLLAVLAGCATSDAELASSAAGVYLRAYGKGDREAVAAVTVPSERDRPLERGIETMARGFTGVTEAEVDGNWAIAGARIRLVGPINVLPILMRRTDSGWLVATIVPPGLTEVLSSFPEYPDPPPDRMEYMPTRRLTSRAWAEDELTPELSLRRPVEVVLDKVLDDPSDLDLWEVRSRQVDRERTTAFTCFKFTVSGVHRVHLSGTSSPDAGLRIALVAPEGGKRASNDRDYKRRGDRFHESEGEAGIQMNLSNATYLLLVTGKKGSRVRLVYESTLPGELQSESP
jgi:hypothetical protein